MKRITLAGIIVVLCAGGATATDGVVTWDIAMPKTTINPAVDSYIEFFVNVEVTGNNQGLGTFVNDIAITKLAGAGPATPGEYINDHPVMSWGNYLVIPLLPRTLPICGSL